MIWLVSGLALGTASCRKAEAPRAGQIGNAVAVVAGEKVTVDMLREELRGEFGSGRSTLTTEQKRTALETLIQKQALYAKAKAAGFDRTPEMQERIRNLIVTRYKEACGPAANPAVAEPEIEQYYTANKTRFAVPLAVHGAVILLEAPANATPEKQQEFNARAEAALAEAKTAASAQEFADVVRRHSTDQASRYRGGDIGWLTSKTIGTDAGLVEALAALKQPGDFAPLVSTHRGVYIAKLLERKDAGCQPLSEVRETIRYQLGRQKAQQAQADFQTSLKAGLDIQVNQAVLESTTLPAEKNEPPPMPERRTAQLRQSSRS
jgi:parvulin-like peptidyl-prolyl isomerase